MTKDQLIKEVDEFVYELELNGVPEEETISAMREYIEIIDDIGRG